jgi:hypothetical protein
MATTQNLIDSVRGGTNKNNTAGPVSDTLIVLWLNEALPVLWRRVADLLPDFFEKITADFTLGAGVTTMDLSGAPLSLTDFGKIIEVQQKVGADYFELPVARQTNPEQSFTLSYKRRGANTLDFYPLVSAPGQTFRVRYVSKQPTLAVASPNAVLGLPDGCEGALVQEVSARVRGRMEEDPTFHLQVRESAWKDLRMSLIREYLGQSIPVTCNDGPETWGW